MEMKEYLVTCKSYKDLQSLYNDMETEGGTLYIPNRAVELLDRREISRNTHYRLTAEEAELISNDKRVKHITLHPDEIEGLEVGLDGFTNFESYTVTGDFTKASSTDTGPYEDDYPWSLLHSAGTVAQRRQYSWGDSPGTERVNDSVDIYGNGKHVDVVIIDGAVGKNFAEWKSDTTGQSRFVEYDWYGEHPEIYSGTYNHPDASGSHDHGNHVCGTVAGRYYGWAREANIYALTYNGSHGTTRIFDLVRAFHKKKPINPVTGRKNPTITNSSWGFRSTSYWTSSSITSINYRGTTYTPSNPGPSGWTAAGLEADFGVAYSGNFPTRYSPLDADLEDALVEGIVIIAAAGNSNHYQVREGHPDFNNTLNSSVFGNNFPMHTGASPGAVPGVICVGAQNSTTDNTRATYTNYGDRIDVFAPGTRTLSVAGRGTYPSVLKGAITRSEYSGIDKLMTIQGTSMASPQVCGIIACAATGRGRFDQDDAIGLIRGLSRDNVIDFDTEPTGSTYQSILDDSSSTSNGYVWFTSNARSVSGNTNANNLYVNPTFTINYYDTIKLYTKTNSTYTADISAAGTGSGYTISGTHRQGNFSGNNPTIHLEQYDHIKFEASTSFSSHPLYIRDSNGNNVTNNGTQTGIDQSGDTYTFVANLPPGTYIYQCAAHPGMQGDIIVHTRGALTSHPLYIRDSNGNNVAEVINNGFSSGHIEWTPGWSAGENVEYVDYTYQCGNHPSMQGTIRVENPWFDSKVGKPGGYDDIRCQQGSPNREIFCNNTRPTTGYISGFKQSTLNGRRRTDREDNNLNQNRQLFPRVNGFYQQ
jgi:plastocyanin